LKKFIAISFLSIFLCATTPIGQLLKLPMLMHHFIEHQQEEQNKEHQISFIDFLKMHYNSNEHTNKSTHNHHNLPFKHIDFNSLNVVFAFESPSIFTFQQTEFDSSKDVSTFYEQHYLSNTLANIWQPPRV
jgi:hypothetical protein